MYAANSPRGWRSAAATFTCVSILSPVGRYFGVRGPRISISAASNVPPGFGCLVLAFLFEGTSLLRGLDNCLVSMRLLSFVARHVGNGRIRDVAAGPAGVWVWARSKLRIGRGC